MVGVIGVFHSVSTPLRADGTNEYHPIRIEDLTPEQRQKVAALEALASPLSENRVFYHYGTPAACDRLNSSGGYVGEIRKRYGALPMGLGTVEGHGLYIAGDPVSSLDYYRGGATQVLIPKGNRLLDLGDPKVFAAVSELGLKPDELGRLPLELVIRYSPSADWYVIKGGEGIRFQAMDWQLVRDSRANAQGIRSFSPLIMLARRAPEGSASLRLAREVASTLHRPSERKLLYEEVAQQGWGAARILVDPDEPTAPSEYRKFAAARWDYHSRRPGISQGDSFVFYEEVADLHHDLDAARIERFRNATFELLVERLEEGDDLRDADRDAIRLLALSPNGIRPSELSVLSSRLGPYQLLSMTEALEELFRSRNFQMHLSVLARDDLITAERCLENLTRSVDDLAGLTIQKADDFGGGFFRFGATAEALRGRLQLSSAQLAQKTGLSTVQAAGQCRAHITQELIQLGGGGRP
jgi:hypothetical protein